MIHLSDVSQSRLAMGTVALGMPYGFSVEGKPQRLLRKDAVKLLHAARDAGVRWFDTAPGYGESEQIVGEAFANDLSVVIATKVDRADADSIEVSIEQSLGRFKREQLDIVQIHNATAELLLQTDTMEMLSKLQQQGKIGQIGASVYGEEAAKAALKAGIKVLQVACNLLDQRMLKQVVTDAEQQNVHLLIRSVFLKGVLTSWGRDLKGELDLLHQAAQGVVESLQIEWEELAEVALRYALHCTQQSHALIGATSLQELQQALLAEQQGPLPEWQMQQIKKLATENDQLLNPSQWPKSNQLSG